MYQTDYVKNRCCGRIGDFAYVGNPKSMEIHAQKVSVVLIKHLCDTGKSVLKDFLQILTCFDTEKTLAQSKNHS